MELGAETFYEPDWREPLDWTAQWQAAPEAATVRGMFMQDLLDDMSKHRIRLPSARNSYVSFKNYPLRDYLTMLREAAELAFPAETPRHALREIGRTIYPRFAQTMVGKSIFTFAGNSFGRMVQLASKAYEVASSVGSLKVVKSEPGYILAELREVWIFPDSLQVGNWEGAMRVAGVTGNIKMRRHSWCDVDFEVHYQDR